MKRAAEQGKLAHLLLFYNSGEKERTEAALELAMLLNCSSVKDRPCHECISCRKISQENHPDIHILKLQKSSIGIEEILKMQENIYKKPFEGKYKVYLIEQADRLTLPAANALLKVAEEPPENTLLILSTANSERIIATLRSRAQEVYFPVPDKDVFLRNGIESETSGEIDYELAYKLGGRDPDLIRRIVAMGTERVENWLETYLAVIKGDFLKMYSLFPLDKEEALVLVQVLQIYFMKEITEGRVPPAYLPSINQAVIALQRQANSRLAIEVLALKQMRIGGNTLG
ncbi:DNA polymerase III subunit [Syntrophobotulus glycolicus]|nr:DNA polymerase III subunit [Syntrophobotulus glycolicus]